MLRHGVTYRVIAIDRTRPKPTAKAIIASLDIFVSRVAVVSFVMPKTTTGFWWCQVQVRAGPSRFPYFSLLTTF
jgi:hypothetical protein